jgi:putative hydrolase of the HAD superfamily
VLETLKFNGHFLGLLTDGRSITQRNKLKALGLEDFFDQLVISEEFGSEKPNIKNYKSFIVESVQSYVIIADNTSKDFITANILNWTSIGILDNGSNIHKQQFDLDNIYLPKYWVKSISEINFIYEH